MTDIDFTVTLGEPARITVAFPGPSGPPGVQGPIGLVGPIGPQGPAGGDPFIFTQSTPSATWTIPHNLGRKPTAIFIEDTAGTRQFGDETNPDTNTSVVYFAAPFAGTARVI